MAIYKRSRKIYNSGQPRNKSMKCSEWDSNPGPTDSKSNTLTTRAPCHSNFMCELMPTSGNNSVTPSTNITPHRTKWHVSVFLKHDGNMELYVSVTFTCCGNVKIQVYVIMSRFRHVSGTEMPIHVSVMFM